MTDDSPEEEFERQRRQAMLDFQAWARSQPPPEPGQPVADPLTVARVRLPGSPDGVHWYLLARWSLLARLATDAADPDQVQLGYPLPGDAGEPGGCPPGGYLILGWTTADGQWHPARPQQDEP